MQIDIDRLDRRLARIENKLALLTNNIMHNLPEEKPKRLPEKKICELYNISKHTLKRMRLGYKRQDGREVPPVLFKWGHKKGRRIDYDVAEFEENFKTTIIS
jgi:hypothetical protein